MVSLSNHERTAHRQACLELAERLSTNGKSSHHFKSVRGLAGHAVAATAQTFAIM